MFGHGNAGNSEWMLYGAILLHGVCYDFFFVTGMIYTDEKAGERIKSQAQALISLATYGIGMFLGSVIAGKVYAAYTTAGAAGKSSTDWTAVWNVPAGIAVVVLLLFLIFFSEKKGSAKQI